MSGKCYCSPNIIMAAFAAGIPVLRWFSILSLTGFAGFVVDLVSGAGWLGTGYQIHKEGLPKWAAETVFPFLCCKCCKGGSGTGGFDTPGAGAPKDDTGGFDSSAL